MINEQEIVINDTDLQELSIQEIIEKYSDRRIYVTTPDGLQEIGNFYIKERECVTIATHKRNDKVSEDHFLLSTEGWIYAKDALGKEVLTTEGFEKITSVESIGKSKVYDFEVLHPEHRYYTNSGFCSHNCGKTFMILNALREAQALGYYAIYGDSEAAVDEELMVKFNIDPTRVRYQPLKTVIQTRHFITNLCQQLREKRDKGFEVPKIMMIIDSLGNLATEKETADALSGSDKRDMTKQQNLKSMFRIITTDLAELKIPLLCTNHVYASIGGYFPSNVQSGGCMIPGTLIQTPDGLKKIEDLKAGDMVLTLEGPKEITHTWMFDDSEESDGSPKKTWEIEFEDGVTYQVSEDHRFLVSQDWENDSAWKKVWELSEDDEILAVA